MTVLPDLSVGTKRNPGALWTRMWKPDGELILDRALGDASKTLAEQSPMVEAQALQDAVLALGDGAVHAIYDGDSGLLIMNFIVGRDEPVRPL